MDKEINRPVKKYKSAAKSAVKNYFEDLMQPLATPIENTPDILENEKLSEAERLLRKAQDISLLLHDEAPSSVKEQQQETLAQNASPTYVKTSHSSLNQPVLLDKPYFEDKQNPHLERVLSAKELAHQALGKNNYQENPQDAEIEDIQETRDACVDLKEHLDNRFQVLLCEVAGLTLAIPLVELGGIHKLTKISPIVGKPEWFMGVLIKGSEKFQCIDTARWIMPEKYTPQLAEKLDYQFAIQLGKTPYVICCDSISTTIELSKDEVKWRVNDGKRPWLAGLLKEKMCALIDGARMVQVVLD